MPLEPPQETPTIAGDRIGNIRINIAACETMDNVHQLLTGTVRIMKADMDDPPGITGITRIALAIPLFEQEDVQAEFLRPYTGTQASQPAADNHNGTRCGCSRCNRLRC